MRPRKFKDPMLPEENPYYHDTFKLLRQYRDVVWGLELAKNKIRIQFQIEYGESIEEFLDSVYIAGADLGGTDIEEQARTIERTRKMLAIIDSSVELLRSKHKHGETYYWLLYYAFLSPQEMENLQDILAALEPHIKNISKRTYYRRRDEAIDALSAILWGYASKASLDILNKFLPSERS